MSKFFVVGQRVYPDPAWAADMPGLKPGIVTKVVDEYAIDVLVDGTKKPQQYGKTVWR